MLIGFVDPFVKSTKEFVGSCFGRFHLQRPLPAIRIRYHRLQNALGVHDGQCIPSPIEFAGLSCSEERVVIANSVMT